MLDLNHICLFYKLLRYKKIEDIRWTGFFWKQIWATLLPVSSQLWGETPGGRLASGLDGKNCETEKSVKDLGKFLILCDMFINITSFVYII